MRTLLSILTILLLSLSALAQDSLNVRRVGYYDTPGYADAVAVSGNYAYVADGTSGLRIIDINNPANPQQVGFYDTLGYAFDVVVSSNLAYVADLDYGLRIINISNPMYPYQVGFVNTPWVSGVAVSGIYAYVAVEGVGLRIIDVSNPANPQVVGFRDYHGRSVAVVGNYAYIAGYSSFGIINISDPVNPQLVGSSNSMFGAERVAVSGNYCYVANGNDGLRIINISNPMYPNQVGFYNTLGYARGVAILGDYAYVADESSGLRIINISNPTNPREDGFYGRTSSIGDHRGVTISGNFVYTAENSSGLGIYDCSLAIRHISITYPNNTFSIPIGSVDTIRWSSATINGNVNIELNRSYPSIAWEMLFANTPNDSSQPWTVTGPYTNSARIRITSVENPAIGDTSDANFTIGIVPATPGNLTVTLQGEDALLAWARVDTSLSGYPITVERYLIFYRDDGAEPWQYLWATFGANTTNFTHTSVVRYSPAMYYEVRAWIGDTDAFDRIIQDIPPGLREDVLLQRIGGNVSAPIVKQVE
ncbi:MAG: hypothetical protein OEM52_07975 [bacterium]|nr:hypothetical protein [bacterium]